MKKILILGSILILTPVSLLAREYSNYTDCTQDNGTKFCDGYFAGKEKPADVSKPEQVTTAADTTQTTPQPAQEQNKTEPKKESAKKPNDNFFFGGSIGLGAVSYKEESMSDYMPSAFLKLGLEFGLKFNVSDDYALGLTGAMDFLAPSEMNPSYVHAMGADSITVGFDMYGFYLDNYLKTGQDETLVFGLGAADIYETVTVKAAGKTYTDSSDEGQSVFLMKMGMIYSLSEMTDFTLMGKFGFPDEKTGLSMITMLDLGFRFKF